MEKLKTGLDTVGKVMNLSNSQLEIVIKENEEMLTANYKLAKESYEGLSALKDFGVKESPALRDALEATSIALKTIEDNRAAMAAKLQKKFLGPLKDLVGKSKKVQKEIEEDNLARIELANAITCFKKLQIEKPDAEGEHIKAEREIDDLRAKSEKEHNDVIEITYDFNQKRVEILKRSLELWIKELLIFHEDAYERIVEAEQKVSEIDIEGELDHSWEVID